MRRLSDFVIKNRGYIIVAVIIVTLGLGYFIKNLKINPDITDYLPKSDPAVALFDYIGEQYSSSHLAIIVIEAEEVFTEETIRKVAELTSEIEVLEGVAYATSLSNVLDIRNNGGWIEIGRLIDPYNLPATDEELERIKDYTLSKGMYRGNLVSEDSKATLLICRLSDDVDRIATVRMIKGVVEDKGFEKRVYYGGFPFIISDLADIILGDLKFLVPLVGLLIILSLFISFRTGRGVLVPLVSVLISTVWTIGLMSILEIPLTIVSDIIPVILIAVGSAYSIHVVSRFDENEESKNENRCEESKKALREIAIPVSLAAVTTIAGFMSFTFGSYLTMIREFGIFTSLGVLFALIVSVTFVPSILSILGGGRFKNRVFKRVGGEKVSDLMERLSKFVLKNRKIIVIVGTVLFILSIIGIPRIEREIDILDYFKPNSNIRLTEQFLDVKFGGSTAIQILAKGDILDPRVLMEIKKVEEFLESIEGVNNPQSIADYIEEMSYVVGEGRVIPDTREKVANLWFFLEGEEMMTQMVNYDKTEALIQATTGSGLKTNYVKRLVEDIQTYIDKRDTSLVKFGLTGMPSIHRGLDVSIKRSQIQSLMIAVVCIFIILVILLRSFVGGLIGLIPIAFALSFIFGFMSITGIPLDIATVLVGSVSIGVGIDYTIHFLSRFRQECKRCQSEYEALHNTMKTSGRAILINMVTVVTGFLVLLLSNLIPLQRFGILISITMISSGFGAIVLLPAVISLTRACWIGELDRFLNNRRNGKRELSTEEHRSWEIIKHRKSPKKH